jgi:predicted transcriptional regulator
MGTRSNSRRVHFQSPEDLVERLDAVAEVFDTDRTDLLIEAMRAFVQETADDEEFQELVAARYYDDQLAFEEVKRLVGTETAQRFRLLKSDLEAEPLDLDPPEDVDVYDGDRRSVDPDASGPEQ